MSDCLFCKFNNCEIPVNKIYEDDDVFAINDINPQAPVHVLIIPKKHLDMIENLTEADAALMGKMVFAAKKIAAQLGLKNGFRLVFNDGEEGQQSVKHIHLHLMGGRQFNWPAG